MNPALITLAPFATKLAVEAVKSISEHNQKSSAQQLEWVKINQQNQLEKQRMNAVITTTVATEVTKAAVALGANVLAYKQATHQANMQLEMATQSHALKMAKVNSKYEQARMEIDAIDESFKAGAESLEKDKELYRNEYQSFVNKALNASSPQEAQAWMALADKVHAKLDKSRDQQMQASAQLTESLTSRRLKLEQSGGAVVDADYKEVD